MTELFLAGFVGFLLGAVFVVFLAVKLGPDDYEPVIQSKYEPSQEMLKAQYSAVNSKFDNIHKEIEGFHKDFNKYVNWRVKQSRQ